MVSLSYPRSYQPMGLEPLYREIAVDFERRLLDYDAQAASQPTFPSSACPALLDWADVTLAWLDRINEAYDALQPYSNVSSSPVPGVELGALNAATDMFDLQEEIGGTVVPPWAAPFQSEIAGAAERVETAAVSIWSAMRTSLVDRTRINFELSSLVALDEELDAILQQVNVVLTTC